MGWAKCPPQPPSPPPTLYGLAHTECIFGLSKPGAVIPQNLKPKCPNGQHGKKLFHFFAPFGAPCPPFSCNVIGLFSFLSLPPRSVRYPINIINTDKFWGVSGGTVLILLIYRKYSLQIPGRGYGGFSRVLLTWVVGPVRTRRLPPTIDESTWGPEQL